MPSSEGYCEIRPAWNDSRGLPAQVTTLSVYRSPALARPHWHPVVVGMVASLGPEDLAAEIAAKEPSVPRILSRCDEAWLLLHADDFRASGFLTVGGSMGRELLPSGFARVFVLEQFSGRVTEL